MLNKWTHPLISEFRLLFGWNALLANPSINRSPPVFPRHGLKLAKSILRIATAISKNEKGSDAVVDY